MASVTVSSAARSLENHRKFISLLFYRAVRDLQPVWMLEEIRTMETFYLEEDAGQRKYTPSEALLYAIVHDHQAYARYLLSRYTEEALAKPGERFCCCPSSAPHLATAVRYDRRYILGLILQVHGSILDCLLTLSIGICFVHKPFTRFNKTIGINIMRYIR